MNSPVKLISKYGLNQISKDTIMTKYLLIASMDIELAKENLFNEVYETEHIPGILNVPGVISVERYKSQPMKMHFSGKLQELDVSAEPTYTAIYEIEGPEVLASEEWGIAVEAGRWPGEVRPFTSNRQFALRKLMA
jgi:hypothetical protein